VKESGAYFAYVLENPQGQFYVGSTVNLERRLQRHNSLQKEGTKFTHKNGPVAAYLVGVSFYSGFCGVPRTTNQAYEVGSLDSGALA
jgi:predicted GIY-YIG superfamily endonuclease